MSDAPDFVIPTPADKDPLRPRFYTRPVLNNFKTQQEGRPIHDEVEYVEVLIPGDRLNQIDRPVKADDKARWPQAYAAFKAGKEAPIEGTALVDWNGITRSQAEDLRYFHIKSVEQLAALTDDQLSKAVPMGGFDLRGRAQRFLEQAAGSAPMEKLAAENDVLRSNMAEMQGQMEAMRAEMARLAARADAAPPPQT